LKVLLIQLRQIGDCLLTTPLVRALAKAKPEAEIHYLVEAPSDQLFTLNPWIKKVFLFPKKGGLGEQCALLRNLRQQRYEVVIDCFGLPKTALLSWFTGAAMRIGMDYRGRIGYSHRVPHERLGKYSALDKLRLLEPLGIQSQDVKLEFPVSAEDQAFAKQLLQALGVQAHRPLVSLSPVSRQPFKVWPAERFSALADRLIEQYNAQILLMRGPGEDHFTEAVRRCMRNSALGNLPVVNLPQTKAVFEQVDLHLGNDNGPMHLAIAAEVPTFAIFGRGRLSNWTPPGQTRHLAIEYNPGCKSGCTWPHCQLECLKGLTVDMAWQALAPLLQQLRKG